MSVLVVGLGQFGTAVAESLIRLDQEVLAVDEDLVLVEKWADELTHCVQADATDEEALRQLGASNFDRAVVAIGKDVEASVLTVLALAQAGVKDIWAKAITHKHGLILERVGAHHVVYP
ncbi:MAG: TrkA family potassium uptake protein, partial [Nocardioidaceae bacterium]|nr:TrkA family potassium uptake protein [Nocardioidaceae bacterium]